MSEQKLIDVLLVEDNQGDARLLEITLSELQVNPIVLHHKSTLSEAQNYLNTHVVDLILLDLSLPDGKGLECIKRIQACNEALAIIILTGLDDQEFAIKTMQHGAQDYLVKGQGDGHLIIRAMYYAIERKQIEQRLTLLAHFDSLTGLANREYFNITLSRSIQQAKRNNQKFGLMFLDLDHFKEINDTLGHSVGDQLLVDVAKRLKKCVRGVDFIARLGGDEFVIILENIEAAKCIISVAEKIVANLSKPFMPSDSEVFVSCSVGITVYPDDASNTTDLVKYADDAMYMAKDKGRNNFQFYTHQLNDQALQTITTKNDLRSAIKRNQLLLYYQPKINLLDNKIVGAEALLRWQHSTRGLIAPDDFIPIAEQSGLIIDIGKWVISNAIKQTIKWQANFHQKFSMSINLSVKQFQNNELINIIDTQIDQSLIQPSTIEFEITESLLMNKSQQEQQILQVLSEKGFKISIDDFGTGYSSLAYLKRFTINELKIDRSFISDITDNADTAEIVKAMIAMAHALKLDVVAEGVESKGQMDFLKTLHCDQVQGFLISKPVPAIEFERLLEQQYG